MKGLDQVLGCLEWAKGTAGLEIGQAFADSAINNGLEREDDLSRFYVGFEQVTHFKADRFPNVLGDYYLIFVFDSDKGHRSSTVELFTSTLAGLTVCYLDKILVH
jgi:hypothetical protein